MVQVVADEATSASNRTGNGVVERPTTSTPLNKPSCLSSGHQDLACQGPEKYRLNSQQETTQQLLHSDTSNSKNQLLSKFTQLTSSTTGNQVKLAGRLVDNHTRCSHYHTVKDIIALKFKCCGIYWPCYQCHLEISACQATQRYSTEELKFQSMFVILCGQCYNELTFDEYNRNTYKCIYCDSEFNPGCLLHYDLYFDLQ